MFKHAIVAACTALLGVGCSTAAPVVDDTPTVTTRQGLVIRGELVDLAKLKIYVNGETVIDDNLWLPKGNGEFEGKFENKRLDVSCSTSRRYRAAYTRCTVAVDGEYKTLTF